MKGIVFHVFEVAVRQAHGEDMWDNILETAGVSGTYTTLGTYPDAELFKLIEVAAGKLGKKPNDLVRWLGTQAMGEFSKRYTHFFTPHKGTMTFLMTLNDVIHPEVRKMLPEASVPDFIFQTMEDGRLRIQYDSAKKMCAFAEGLIEGAARHFGQVSHIEHPECMHRGAKSCVLICSFSAA